MPCRAKYLLALISCCSLSYAQTEVGGASLNGTVSDPSGATIASAKVTATNTGTGLVRPLQSSSAGLYNFSRLPAGSYDLLIEAPGFNQSRKTGILLNVGPAPTFDVTLEVGTAQERVSVTADVPAVKTP